MKNFEIKYNDGVHAAIITFKDNYTNDFIEGFLQDEIKKFNNNPNKDYHITRENIKEI